MPRPSSFSVVARCAWSCGYAVVFYGLFHHLTTTLAQPAVFLTDAGRIAQVVEDVLSKRKQKMQLWLIFHFRVSSLTYPKAAFALPPAMYFNNLVVFLYIKSFFRRSPRFSREVKAGLLKSWSEDEEKRKKLRYNFLNCFNVISARSHVQIVN